MISSIKKTIQFISKHPIAKKNKWQAINRYFKWQLGSRLIPYPIIYPFVEESKLIVAKGMTGATGNIYTGLHDFEEMGFILHLLRPTDLFVDIGANIGSYTILATAVAGAETFCFEPVPTTYRHLVNNIFINDIEDKVRAFNIGLGDKNGKIKFSLHLDTVNHVLSNEENGIDFIEVPIALLDESIADFTPLLIKLDVEGFEYQVLQGSKNSLEDPKLKAIIIELNGSGGRYGIADETIHQFLSSFDFKPCQYDPFKRSIKELPSFKPNGNTIYVRDFDFVRKRVESQRKIKIHAAEF